MLSHSAKLLSVLISISSLTAAFPGGNLFERACNADNCLRSVRGNSNGVADCSANLKTTLIGCGGAASTVTELVTVTNYDYTTTTVYYSGTPYVKRAAACATSTVAPSVFPTYASACSNIARYSSACACVGVAPSTITSSAGAGGITTITSTTTTVKPYTFTKSVDTNSGDYKEFKLQLADGRFVDAQQGWNSPLQASPASPTYAFTSDRHVFVSKTSDKYHWPIELGVKTVTGLDQGYLLGKDDAGVRVQCSLASPGTYTGTLSCTVNGVQRYPVLCAADSIAWSLTPQYDGCTSTTITAIKAN